MENHSDKSIKHIAVGLLAHVDAGKTTFAEALLFANGSIKQPGRVDWRNTYLDTHTLERERGITIFSKQAILSTPEAEITLMDTPGHVDFSAEMERTLSVLDYAVLVISAADGVQAHTQTLWKLLEQYQIPTFLFVTKMDLQRRGKDAILQEITACFGECCIDFTNKADLDERIAMTNEKLLDFYVETGEIPQNEIVERIAARRLFPCFFGSGLKIEGMDALLQALLQDTKEPYYDTTFSARVFKIGYDKNGVRLTYLKVTGGMLAVRQSISYAVSHTAEKREEKITGIRLYSGEKYRSVDCVQAGQICVVTGLSETVAGQGLGKNIKIQIPHLEPVLRYRMVIPDDIDIRAFYAKLQRLEEEEPLLHIVWDERFGEIHAQLMGEVQCEVVTRLISERYGIEISFADGSIMYKESILSSTEGVGHFEPLRHYAEVHLRLTPLPTGSGMEFDSAVNDDYLERNWQKLILAYLAEKEHLGVLTGSPVTDMRITLVSGRSHIKHTQSIDFRESTYRAVRQGLMVLRSKAQCVLLEPYYAFRLELPIACVGRAMTDILARNGTFEEHAATPGVSVLEGRAPVATIRDYAKEIASYTHGKGKFSCRVMGYFPCHNADEVIASYQYDPEGDLNNTPDSVFCAHGSGFVVPWYNVPEYMHIPFAERTSDASLMSAEDPRNTVSKRKIDDREWEAIMDREFGPIRRKVYSPAKKIILPETKLSQIKPCLYIIDGYNLIFAWDELKKLAEYDLDHARCVLCDILENYQAFTHRELVVVFDAYHVKGAAERKLTKNGLHIVYTKEDELADTYIERLTHDIGNDYTVRVVTSDGMIQLQAVRSGVLRMSAREFRQEILETDEEIRDILKSLREKND